MPRPQILETIAEEEGTYILNLAFKDEDDEEVTPTSVKWTLTTLDGVVVNNRQEVSETPAPSIDVVLKGPDLQLLDHKTSFSWRLFTVIAAYNSDLAPGLPLHGAVRFRVRNLRLIAADLNIVVSEGVFVGAVPTVAVA